MHKLELRLHKEGHRLAEMEEELEQEALGGGAY